MGTLDSHRNLARALGRAGFTARFPYGFLVHRPIASHDDEGEGEGEDDEDLGFTTGVVNRDDLEIDLLEGGKVLSVREWIIEPVLKRRGNPYPERISVGRAKNSDVVLRYPSVSKLHAHFRLAGDKLEQLTDYQSSNGTYINGERLAPGQGMAVRYGDRVRFGVLELQLVTAVALHAELVRASIVAKVEG